MSAFRKGAQAPRGRPNKRTISLERRASLRRSLLYFAVVPSVVIAVVLLGAVALRTTLEVEKARQQTIFDATLSLADERVDRLDKLIVAQDNVAIGHVDFTDLDAIATNWLPTADRETPTIVGILVLDMDHAAHDVLAFATRLPLPQADKFRRILVHRLFPAMNLQGDVQELRHLHQEIARQSYLISYWQRIYRGRKYMVVAWHDVPRIVHDVLPQLYRDTNRDAVRGNSVMNVVDEQGAIVFGPPIQSGEFTVGLPFPTTLYNWRLQTALTSAEELREKVERQREIELWLVSAAAVVALLGIAVVLLASLQERKVAALKSEFVANVSHELKTPLALVRMFGELLLLDKVKNDEKRRQYLQIIVSESERLTALIENVLDFARVEQGQAPYDFAMGDVGAVILRAVDIHRQRAEREGMTVAVDVPDDLSATRIDARALELALMNLLDNAVKYAREGKEIVVVAREEDDLITVSVTDRGPGIAADEQGQIFERFVRGRDARSGQVRGSGIGLALVRHIVEAHGGDVSVKSPVDSGGGSTFTLRIPVVVSSQSSDVPEAQALA